MDKDAEIILNDYINEISDELDTILNEKKLSNEKKGLKIDKLITRVKKTINSIGKRRVGRPSTKEKKIKGKVGRPSTKEKKTFIRPVGRPKKIKGSKISDEEAEKELSKKPLTDSVPNPIGKTKEEGEIIKLNRIGPDEIAKRSVVSTVGDRTPIWAVQPSTTENQKKIDELKKQIETDQKAKKEKIEKLQKTTQNLEEQLNKQRLKEQQESQQKDDLLLTQQSANLQLERLDDMIRQTKDEIHLLHPQLSGAIQEHSEKSKVETDKLIEEQIRVVNGIIQHELSPLTSLLEKSALEQKASRLDLVEILKNLEIEIASAKETDDMPRLEEAMNKFNELLTYYNTRLNASDEILDRQHNEIKENFKRIEGKIDGFKLPDELKKILYDVLNTTHQEYLDRFEKVKDFLHNDIASLRSIVFQSHFNDETILNDIRSRIIEIEDLKVSSQQKLKYIIKLYEKSKK